MNYEELPQVRTSQADVEMEFPIFELVDDCACRCDGWGRYCSIADAAARKYTQVFEGQYPGALSTKELLRLMR